jgi:hypothetical protein
VTAKYTYDALNEQVRTDQSAPTYSVATENAFNTSGQLASLWLVGGAQLLGKAYWGATPVLRSVKEYGVFPVPRLDGD